MAVHIVLVKLPVAILTPQQFRVKYYYSQSSFRTPPVPSVFEDNPVYRRRRRRERALSSLPALRVQIPQVFKHYARAAGDESEGIVSAAAMDRRAIGAAISVATNTVCQQDDARVAQILARYANGSGTLLLDEFLEYWRSRLGGTQMCRSQLSSDAKLTLLAI